VLRHFVLGGDHLHDDDDPRHIAVLSDDERPLIFYGEKDAMKQKQRAEPKG
jgi:manganese/iron transport system ATP-binding protein